MKRLTANDVMTPRVLPAQADWPLGRLAEFFVEHEISGAPVTDDQGILVGVVSLRDLVRYDSLPDREPPRRPHDYYLNLYADYAEEEVHSFRLSGERSATVREIMTTSVFSVTADTPVDEIAETMVRGHIHRLLVTREHAVVGIVTSLDLLRVIRDLLPASPAPA